MTHIPRAKRLVRRPGNIALTIGLIGGVAACTPSGDLMFGTRDAATESPVELSAAPDTNRDVEAPEVFDVNDEGLWDGRPSLGGVWVAHADATDPERVIIRNTESGSFVIGALFRRERENPGPPIQISSEAAEALDILAGNPTNLQITALRTPEPEPEPVEPEAAEIAPEAPETPEAEIIEPVIAVAEPDAAPDGEPDTDGDAIVAAAEDVTPEPTSAASALSIGALTAGLFGRNAPDDAAEARAEIETSEIEAAEIETTELAPIPQPNITAEEIASGIETVAFSTADFEPQASVTDVASLADAAITESEIAAVGSAVTPAIASDTALEPTPARASQATEIEPMNRAYVQVGLYSVQENADSVGEALRSAGLVPTIQDLTSDGRQLWRVLVGPAPSAEDREAILETVRGIGFEDAYIVSR